MLAPALILASAASVLLLGALHLLHTFTSNKFQPRDPALRCWLRTPLLGISVALVLFSSGCVLMAA